MCKYEKEEVPFDFYLIDWSSTGNCISHWANDECGKRIYAHNFFFNNLWKLITELLLLSRVYMYILLPFLHFRVSFFLYYYNLKYKFFFRRFFTVFSFFFSSYVFSSPSSFVVLIKRFDVELGPRLQKSKYCLSKFAIRLSLDVSFKVACCCCCYNYDCYLNKKRKRI